MSQQGPGFTNPTQPRPGRSQSSQSSYGANSNQQAGRGPGGSGRGRNDFSGRGPKRGGPNVGPQGPNAFEDQSAFHKGQHINFQVDSNGGPPAPAPSQMAPNGPPGGALAFGSFEQPPVPTRHAANQQQARPNMAQQHSGSVPGGPQQPQLGRRPSSGGPRNNGYKHQYDPQSQSAPQQAMHFGAGFNTGPQGSQNFNMSQQQGYGFTPQGGFYSQYSNMMMPQGHYPQNYTGAQQSQNNRAQPMPNQFQRPSQQQGRAQSQAQPHQQPQASVPASRRKKALDIIDPTTHSKVEISPRSAEAAVSEPGSAKPTPTPSPHKEQPLAKPESKALPITSADKDDITASQVPSSQAAAILDSDAASSQLQPKPAAPASDKQSQDTSHASAPQQPQQPSEQSYGKPSTSGRDAAPAKQQAASVAGQQDAQQKPQAGKATEQKPGAAAAPKGGGAWGGTKSFRDIAAGNKPDKAAEDKQAAEEEAKQKAEEAERKAEADRQAEADRKAAAEQKAEAERKAEAEKQAEAKRKADAEKAQQEAEAKAKADCEAEEKKKAEQEAAAKAEEAQRQREKEQQAAEQERQRKEQADKEAAAEAKRKAEAEAKAKAEQEAEAKRKADAEAEAKRKAEAERQAEAEQKAAADKQAADKARQQEEAAAASAQKTKDDEAKAAKASAEEAAKAKSEEAAPAAAAPSSSSLSAKQKRKDMMKRAEEKDTAAGYEDPFQPKQAAAASPTAPAAGPQPVKTQAETSGRSASGDVDEDDWEQTAERTPRGLTGGPSSGPASTSGRKGYSLDWMLTQQERPDCQQLPPDLTGELVAPGWRYVTPAAAAGGFGEPTRVPGGGRHGGMGPAGGRGMGPRNIGPPAGLGGPVDKWQQSGPIPPLQDPRARGAPPMGMAQGGRGGPAGRGAGNVEGDRWGKRALPPPPPGAGGAAIPNLPALHKTENKFKLGEIQGDNPEEIKKQKAIKGLLNKITPEKFDKILNDIINVGYETEQTESGLIDQVFDKALTETTFCEIYADLCHQLNTVLPSFEPEARDGKRRTSTFRKQLLNKCQEEFEKGAAAMEAVEAREKAESSKTKEQKEQDQAEAAEASGSEEEASTAEASEGGEGREEGEIPATAAPVTPADKKAQRLQARRAAAKAAADELKARQRALGNIQFIGHLYRKKMLTEKIMHECIKKLLADVEQPKQEDLECLSKLMSTVGRQLDSNINAKMYMDAYFERVFMLSKNQSLDSRIRFMLQDLLDLRHNAWVARREVEGPKKIDQVHADARREESNRARAAAGGPNRGSRGGDYRNTALDAYGGPPQRRMPSRHDSMIDSPVRPMQRNSSQEFTSFRPGGGPGPGSLRPGGASSGAMLPRSSSLAPSGQQALTESRGAGGKREAQAEPAAAPSQAPTPAPKALSREELENKVRGTLEEYFSALDKAEVTQTVKELLDRAEAAQVFAQIPLVAVGKMRGVNWDVITELMVHLCSGDQAVITQKSVQAGCCFLLNTMGVEDVLGDAPKAADWVGGVLGALVAEGVLPLKEVGSATIKAAVEEEGEDGQLVDGGSAWKLIGAVLKAVAQGTSQAQMARQWKETGLDLKAFFPQFERDDEGLDKRVAKAYDLSGLLPKPDIKPHIQEAIGKGNSTDAMMKWVLEEVGPDAVKDTDTAKQLTLAVLRHAIPNPKEVNLDEKLAPLSPSKASGDLLTVFSSKGGLKAEVGTILGAQQFFHESGAPKRLMQRLLEDLVDCGSVTYDAVQDWQHDNKDQTPSKEAAIKDSAKLVASLAAKDAENTDINN